MADRKLRPSRHLEINFSSCTGPHSDRLSGLIFVGSPSSFWQTFKIGCIMGSEIDLGLVFLAAITRPDHHSATVSHKPAPTQNHHPHHHPFSIEIVKNFTFPKEGAGFGPSLSVRPRQRQQLFLKIFCLHTLFSEDLAILAKYL